ncbi:hypothetical protein EYV94_22865 [Puteibacter caeruleilacunae]|nr:hypothetical protein EYV94_22865 [Puteibacter caeruleilacunae]
MKNLGRLSWICYDYGKRLYDPSLARFTTIDPLAEVYYPQSSYHYALNNPIKYKDYLGMGAQEKGKEEEKKKATRASQSIFSWLGFTGTKGESVRNNYVVTVSNLDATDSKGRTEAKVKARKSTPAVLKAKAEKMRPMKSESTRVNGTANKSNAAVNNKVKTYGKVGRANLAAGVVVSTVNIATADDKSLAVAQEGGAWTGAIMGGELGAKGGAVIAGLPGAIIGGLGGAIAGGIVGEKIGEEVHDLMPDSRTMTPEEFMNSYDWDKYGSGTR